MPRPRKIKFEQGTVYLQDFPKELADRLETHIEEFFTAGDGPPRGLVSETDLKEVTLEESPVLEKIVNNSLPCPPNVQLKEKALGVVGNTVYTVSYNPETNEANIESKEPQLNKLEAINRFKRKAVDLNFV